MRAIAETTAGRPRYRTRRLSRGGARAGWRSLALLVCLPVLIPLGAALWSWTMVDSEVLAHVRSHVLPLASFNTTVLLLLVGAGVVALGVGVAAPVALLEFPGRRFFSFVLLLPLALPGYVLAVAWLGMLDYAAPLPSWLREHGITLPEIRNRAGVVFVLVMSLYPYVYLISREAFAGVGMRSIEAARNVGMSPLRAFFRVTLRMAAPWIAAGASLAMMETLADFGTVAAFNHDTLSVAIYKVWYGQFSPNGALQIASVMLLFVLVLLVLEARSRHNMRFQTVGMRAGMRFDAGRRRWLVTAWCSLVFVLAFVLPVAWLLTAAWAHRDLLDARFTQWAVNSALLAGMAAAVLAVVALLLVIAAQLAPGRLVAGARRLATLGYAFPGALLAVGLYVPLAHFAGWLDRGGVATGGVLLLMLGYSVRFLAVAHAPVAASAERIRPQVLDAARLCGMPQPRLLGLVYWPALRSSVAIAALLVFVDVMKEMPITLMMRPFGWDTLATRIFEYTSEGQWTEAAVPAVALLLVGLLPIWLLQRHTTAMQ